MKIATAVAQLAALSAALIGFRLGLALPRPGRLALAVSGGYRAVLLGWARSAHGSKGQRMFGHDWQPAAGTVVDIRVKHPNSENDSRSWLMEVRCGDAEPFRVELGYPGFHEDFKGPGLGETVQVKADLKRRDARWDLSDPALSWKADRNRQAAEFKAEKERPV
jgi:hypothetical protein